MNNVRSKNLAALFKESRTRTIILIMAGLLIVAIVVGIVSFRQRIMGTRNAEGTVAGAPGAIESVPGGFNVSQRYAKLLQEANVKRAQEAAERGESAIPTIIRSQRLGPGEGVGGKVSGGVGFRQLIRAREGGKQKGYWLDELKKSHCSPAVVRQAIKEGVSLEAIRKEGCSACELRNAGLTAKQLLAAGYTPEELKGAGYSNAQIRQAQGLPEGVTPADIRKAGCSVEALSREREAGVSAGEISRIAGCGASALKAAGYSAKDLRAAGFTAAQLKHAGFTPEQLKQAGYSAAQIRQVQGLPEGVTPADVRNAGCSVEALRQEREAGVSASEISRIAGCGASALKAAGYSAKDLRAAGFTAAQLKHAGFTPEQLKQAGYSAANLLRAGYTPKQLAKAGYTAAQIKTAEKAVPVLPSGYSLASLRKGGCNIEALARARRAGVSAGTIKQVLGCDAETLKKAGFSVSDLKRAAYSPAELKAAGYTADQLKQAGLSPRQLKAAGYTAEQLKQAGFTPQQLKAAGYTAKQLKQAGFTPQQLKAAAYTAGQLTRAGFTPQQLKAAGYTAGQLTQAGFTPQQLKAAGYTADQLKQAGFTPQQLKATGYTAEQLKRAGFTPQQLKEAGYTAEQLKRAGYTPQQLRQAGYSPQEVEDVISATPGTKLTFPSVTVPTADSEAQQLARIRKQQQAEISIQQRRQMLQQISSAMQSQAGQLFQVWTITSQTYVAGAKSGKNGEAKGGRPAGKGGPAVVAVPLVKAGNIAFAILDTAVNSDEPGPVLARIVQGKLKGAKLIGTLTRQGGKILLSFNIMTLQKYPSSIAISAVAIDPNTARTALSSDTDYHYLLRYGSLFAASFMQGYGQAITQQGSEVTTNGGATTVTSKKLSGLQEALGGLGQVGQTWGAQLQPIFDTPPTVKIYSGTALGILFEKDIPTPSAT